MCSLNIFILESEVNKMFGIILTFGELREINATDITWDEKSRTLRLLNKGKQVARFNMDNIVGWVDMNAVPKEDYYKFWRGEERPIE